MALCMTLIGDIENMNLALGYDEYEGIPLE